MIEIEVKYQFINKPETINSLSSLGFKIQSYIYYDTNYRFLIKQGHFMRVEN